MFIGQERMRVRLREGEGASVCTLESCHMGLTAQEVAQKFLRISTYTEEYAHQIVHQHSVSQRSGPQRQPAKPVHSQSY